MHERPSIFTIYFIHQLFQFLFHPFNFIIIVVILHRRSGCFFTNNTIHRFIYLKETGHKILKCNLSIGI